MCSQLQAGSSDAPTGSPFAMVCHARLTCALLAQNPVMPVLDFDSYLDGENITNQDLVAWVSMGIIHVPRGALQAASLLTSSTALQASRHASSTAWPAFATCTATGACLTDHTAL